MVTAAGEFAIPQDLDKPKPKPAQRARERDKCECGRKFGEEVVTYHRDGPFWVLWMCGAPEGQYTWHTELTCPACGKQWYYDAERKGRQAAFE
jgi:hypothetical protein